MEILRAALTGVFGLTLATAGFFVSLLLGLALMGTLALATMAMAASARLSPVKVRARVHPGRAAAARSGDRINRVWNDGRGTIIDM